MFRKLLNRKKGTLLPSLPEMLDAEQKRIEEEVKYMEYLNDMAQRIADKDSGLTINDLLKLERTVAEKYRKYHL